MPGTGHSHRYKGSISNRVRKSPFQQLAEWNAQLLGADGSVPTITGGGGSLAFKKLDASDINNVMHNPATTKLVMDGFGITSNTALTLQSDNKITLDSSSVVLGGTSASDTIGFFGEGGTTQDASGSISTFPQLNDYLVRLGLLKN